MGCMQPTISSQRSDDTSSLVSTPTNVSISEQPIVEWNATLGLLGRLPLEIRRIIWQHSIPASQDEGKPYRDQIERVGQNVGKSKGWREFRIHTILDDLDPHHSKLDILRASRGIYKEVVDLIYPTDQKPFIISPVTGEFTSEMDNHFMIWNGKKNGGVWKLSSLEEMKVRGFPNMGRGPIGFRIVIDAPNLWEYCSITHQFTKLQYLARMLQEWVKYPTTLEIELRNTATTRWGEEQDDPETCEIHDKSHQPYHQMMLGAFILLRNVKFSLFFPTGFDLTLSESGIKWIDTFTNVLASTPSGVVEAKKLSYTEAMRGSRYMHLPKELPKPSLADWPPGFTVVPFPENLRPVFCRCEIAPMLRLQYFLKHHQGRSLQVNDRRYRLTEVLKGRPRRPWTDVQDEFISRLQMNFDLLPRAEKEIRRREYEARLLDLGED